MSTEFNLRAMTLRSFCIPPKMKISEVIETYGQGHNNGCDYISFQSHQIVRFSDSQNSLPDLYLNVLEKERMLVPALQATEQNCSTDGNSSHIMQTFALVGEEHGFWEEKSPFLYITYIQTTDYDENGYCQQIKGKDTRYDKLYRAIDEQLKGSGTKFVLYYSYDFCDYILITSGFDIGRQNELLWQMAMGEKTRSFTCIRDTFTFFAVQIECLRLDSTGKICNYGPTSCSQIGPFTIRLSAYSSSALKYIFSKLKDNGIPYEASRILGRYDLELRTKNSLTFEQFCRLIIWLDEAFSCCDITNEYTPFGGYEFMPSTLLRDPMNDTIGRKQKRNRDFCNSLINRLQELPSTGSDEATDGAIRYLVEAKRSLLELIENGFSTEFILGITEPFCAAYENLYAYETPCDEFQEATQQVFHALNTLALCMMHGERRFIQAPAFNANYFDIPPKLFAFYSTVIRRVAAVYQSSINPDLLSNTGNDAYRFLMVPDYRNDIFINPIKYPDKTKKPYVCLIYLAEKFFYDPVKAIYLILHETAHYLSDRKREERMGFVFRTVANLMIFCVAQDSLLDDQGLNLPKLDEKLQALCNGTSIYGKLAGEVAQFFVKCYEDYFQQHISPKYESAENAAFEKYYYRNIINFLHDTEYGLQLFKDAQYAETLKRNWVTVAEENCEAWAMVNGFVKSQLKGVVMSEEANPPISRKYLARLFANRFFAALTDFSVLQGNESALKNYYRFCEEIVLDFQEAFADYRMTEMLDDLFDLKIYETFLEEIPTKRSDFGTAVRHDAVMGVAKLYGQEYQNKIKQPTEIDQTVAIHCAQLIGIRGIIDYLNACEPVCRKNNKNLKAIKKAVSVFSSGPDHHAERCLYILQELDFYMKELKQTAR